MPLDPMVKGFLDQMAAVPGPKMWELDPAVAREMFNAMMQMVGPKDVPIGKVQNLTMPGPGGEIRLRNYTPVGAKSEPLPTLVFYHGGGFVIGNLDTHDGLCRMLANDAGVRVIAVDYRLSPESKYPGAVDDAIAAVTWIEAHAADLGVDANRVAVGGDSAGGALAAVVCEQAKLKGAPTIAFQLLLFPVTQVNAKTGSMHKNAEGYFLELATLEWFYDHYGANADVDKSDPRISPLRAKDFSGLPPAYIVTAEFDPLHDDGVHYAEKLRAAGVSVTHVDYPGLVHDFIYLQAIIPQAPEAMKAAAAALKGALK
ncbi:MAG: alpha/beta hydrolase [Rhizomicrobium sp.]